MAFTPIEDTISENGDWGIIHDLEDQPNTDDEHDGSWLRGMFDKAGRQIAEYINETLIPELEAMKADNISVDAIGVLAANDLQSILEALYDTTVSGVTDHGVTHIKLSAYNDGSTNTPAVERDNIKNGEVIHDKLANDAVEANNIKNGEVVDGKLGTNSVNASNIKENAVSQTIGSITIPATWSYDGPPYMQEIAVSGLVPEDEDHPITWAITSGATLDQLSFAADTNTVIVSTSVKFYGDIQVTATQSNVSHSFTIDADNWIPTGLPMKQEVSVTGLLAADTPIIDMIPDEDFDTAEAQNEAYSFIYRMIAGAGKLTCYATEEPQASIPIQIKVVRK